MYIKDGLGGIVVETVKNTWFDLFWIPFVGYYI